MNPVSFLGDQMEPSVTEQPKKRGRPKGSRNKPKRPCEALMNSSVEDSSVPLSSPPRAPAPEDCQEVNCSHIVIFDQHFDTNKWMLYLRAEHHYKQQQKQAEDDNDKDDEDFDV